MPIDTPRQNTGQLSTQAIAAAREYLKDHGAGAHEVVTLADIIERHTRTVELRRALNKIVNNWGNLHPKDLQQARAALAAPERTEPHAS